MAARPSDQREAAAVVPAPTQRRTARSFTRRRLAGLFGACLSLALLAGLFGACLSLALLAGCGDGAKWHAINVSGSLRPLSFSMTRSEDGKPVTQNDYRGQIVLLYFGYTFCPDVCPATLSNIAEILARLGPDAQQVRVLFVTVNPNRDTAAVLAPYVRNFAPQVEGLRGTPDQLADLARRYRIAYSATPATGDHPYEVTHSAGVYVFDGSGAARLIIAGLASTAPDIAGDAADLKRLVEEEHPPGLSARLRRWL